jgi:hypothetical protein
MPEQPPDAILAEAVEQDVGERRAGLSLARGENGDAMREMERQAGVGDQHEEVLVPFGGGGGADRDLFGTRAAGCDELAHPAQRFDDLRARIGAGDNRHAGGRCAIASDDLPRKPTRISTGIAPSQRNGLGEQSQQWAPDRGDGRETIDLDRAERRGRVGDALERGIAQIARRQHAGGEVGANTALDLGEVGKPCAALSEALEREIGLPDLGERPGDRARRAGKLTDAFELRETARLERGANGGIQILGARRADEAAGETGGELRQSENLHAGFAALRGLDSAHSEGQRPLDDDGPPDHRTSPETASARAAGARLPFGPRSWPFAPKRRTPGGDNLL